MASILVAMHAPDGSCTVEMIPAGSSVKFSHFKVVGGDPSKWNNVECSGNKIHAENKDSTQHLWIACELEEGHFGDCGGVAFEYLGGNSCSMWVSVNGGKQIVVSTNPGFEKKAKVYEAFCFMASALPHLDKKFLK